MDESVAEAGVITLRDGSAVAYRPIRSSDQGALQRFHGRHSDLSIYLRFFVMQRALGTAQARELTELDGVDRFALVALDPADPGEIIGVVRFDHELGTDRAEYAAIIAGAWQGRGLGLELTRRLAAAARRRGVATLRAFVLPQNVPMLNLLRALGLPRTTTYEDGVERIDVDLRGGDLG